MVNAAHRKSVTDEILEVASSAIHRLKKFALTDEDSDDKSEIPESTDERLLGIELENMNLTARNNSLASDCLEKTVD